MWPTKSSKYPFATLQIPSLVLFYLLLWKLGASPVEGQLGVNPKPLRSRSIQVEPLSTVDCMKATFNCSSPYLDCTSPTEFEFPALYNIRERYLDQCGADGALLFHKPGTKKVVTKFNATFSNLVCVAIAGADWVMYPAASIWERVTTWKFPLFQLIAVSSRAPLGFCVAGFIIVHLLGDPIGSLTDLLRKFDNCQSRADYWKYELENDLAALVGGRGERYGRLWKALALIVVSCDEWGFIVGEKARLCLKEELTLLCSESASLESCNLFVDLCLKLGARLAADRSTKSLQVITAQAFFIGTVFIAIVRTKSLAEGINPQTYIDIEMYSIGFTALFFWVMPNVTLSSVIGASQTANTIPDLLREFRGNLIRMFPGQTVDFPSDFSDEERRYQGGIDSWQPAEAYHGFFRTTSLHLERRMSSTTHPQRRPSIHVVRFLRIWPWIVALLPLFTIFFATFTGMLLTWLVPPVGWSCRSNAQFAIFAAWVLNYALSFIPCPKHRKIYFWITFLKDFIFMGMTLGLVIATQFGIFNKCSCYTIGNRVGLALPQIQEIKEILQHRLVVHYPAITAMGIIVQLIVIPGIIVIRYFAAVKVFLQRDDGRSNLQWLYNVKSRTWWKEQWRSFRAWRRGNRSDSTEPEQANSERESFMDGGEGHIVEEDETKSESVNAEEVTVSPAEVALNPPQQALH